MSRPPLPPYTPETAAQKVRAAEDGWNGRDPSRVAMAYTVDSEWRNRAEFPKGTLQTASRSGLRARLGINRRGFSIGQGQVG